VSEKIMGLFMKFYKFTSFVFGFMKKKVFLKVREARGDFY